MTQETVQIGPYTTFSGRLIVIEPKHRWQVQIDWNAPKASHGSLRLSHAASNTVIELRWRDGSMFFRNNHDKQWRTISQAQLAERGIILPPWQLAQVLTGNIPAQFHRQDTGLWLSKNRTIRLRWYAESQRLVMTDIAHGRQATLVIQ